MTKYDFLYNVPEEICPGSYHHNDNIVQASAKILIKLRKHDELVCCAQMQSGKTDVMRRLVYLINTYNVKIAKLDLAINQCNIYVILCASSINLKMQLKSKLPEIENNIYHLNDINTFRKNVPEYVQLFIKMADSSLIIFDECHCDAEVKGLVDEFRKLLAKYAALSQTSFKRIGFSATPYEQIAINYPKVIMYPGDHYYGLVSIFNSLTSGRPIIFQAKNLYEPNECAELFEEIGIHNYYYIIRLANTKVNEQQIIVNMEKQMKARKISFDSYVYDMSYAKSINELIDTRPAKPVLIYLKDKLRMGEYLNTKYVYMVHDDPTNTYTHTTAQSLLGRCCGYNKKSHHTIIYCDLEKAYQHYEWIINDYSRDYLPGNAKYLTMYYGKIKPNCIYTEN